jgi:nucleoside-diphosphate-sugar epimerase
MKKWSSDNAARVVVLGGTGFVGEAFANCWVSSMASPIRYLVHRSHPEWLKCVEVEIESVELGDPGQVLTALHGHDVLVNLLRPDGSGWYLSLMQRLQPIFMQSGIRRCIHASSIDVYAGVYDKLVDEATPPQPLSPYEVEHLSAEALLKDSFSETIVLRLGAVFGRGGRNLISLAEEMKRAPLWKIVLRRTLYGARRMHLVSVETVAQALVHLSRCRPLGSQTVLITDDGHSDNNFAFVQDRFAAAFLREIPKFGPTVPKSLLGLLLHCRGISGRNIDRRFSPDKAGSLGLISEPFADRLEMYASYLAQKMGRYGE